MPLDGVATVDRFQRSNDDAVLLVLAFRRHGIFGHEHPARDALRVLLLDPLGRVGRRRE